MTTAVRARWRWRERRRGPDKERGTLRSRRLASIPDAGTVGFVGEVARSLVAAGFPIWDELGPDGGVRLWAWPAPGGGQAANLQWNLHDCLQLTEDEGGFPVMELVKAVNQALGVALELQGFEVLPLDTEILVRPGGSSMVLAPAAVPRRRGRA